MIFRERHKNSKKRLTIISSSKLTILVNLFFEQLVSLLIYLIKIDEFD